MNELADLAEILHESCWRVSTLLVWRRAWPNKFIQHCPTNQKWCLQRFFENSSYFNFFSMKHPHTIAFKHYLGKRYSHIDLFATICLILYCFVYKICLIKRNLHEKCAQLTKFFHAFLNVTSSAIQWYIVLLNLNH